jgi:N-methylhydantoinase A
MREGLKDDRYNLRMAPPEPLVPRHLRLGVDERLAADGSVLRPLDPASLDEAVLALEAAEIQSVAVCYLHAYRNPAHEAQTLERLRQKLPGLFVSVSSDVLPQIKEYQRVSTTVVNAYVGPAIRNYLTRLEQRLAEAGFSGALFIILSHGGVAPVEEAVRLAAATVLSGPAGGIAGSRRCAELLEIPDLIPFDMGGTSTDISLIAGGRAALSAERGLAGQPIALRSLDIVSIGAGGGSIARVDPGGALQVGPHSAGAAPGPACYGHGGEAATVTDANLLLGYLDARFFLGGRRTLDVVAAEGAVDRVAQRLGLSREETAIGIFRLINLKMADGIRLATLRRGLDPRGFALLSFGGAAGLHAVEVARELEMTRVVVPTMASVLSAWGMLATDLRYEVSRTHIGDTAELGDERLREVFGDLERSATERLRGWFSGSLGLERSAEMRYGEQIFEIDVPLQDLDWTADGVTTRVVERFHRRHEELYTYASPDQEVVLVNARVAAVGAVAGRAGEEPARAPTSGPAIAHTYRRAYLGGWQAVPVYRLDDLAPGHEVDGAAIVESDTTTVVIGPGDRIAVNPLGWLDIRLGGASTGAESR